MKNSDDLKKTNNAAVPTFELEEQELAGVFSDYRGSVQAWSSNVMNRERRIVTVSARRPLSLRLATFAFTAVLIASVVTGGLVQHQRNLKEVAQIAQQKAEEKRLADQKLAEKKAAEIQLAQNQQDDELLADVDSDIAQDTPAAMEPLASLMEK